MESRKGGDNATMRLYGCGRQTGNARAVAAQACGGLTTWLGDLGVRRPQPETH